MSELTKLYEKINKKKYVNIYNPKNKWKPKMTLKEFDDVLCIKTCGYTKIFSKCIVSGNLISEIMFDKTDINDKYLCIYPLENIEIENIRMYDKNIKKCDGFYSVTNSYGVTVKIYNKIFTIQEIKAKITDKIYYDYVSIYAIISLYYMNIYKNINIDIEGDILCEKEHKILFETLVCNSKRFTEIVLNNIKSDIIVNIYMMSIKLEKYENIEILVKNNIFPTSEQIFYIIGKKQTRMLKILMDNKMSLDILNDKALTPIEMVMDLCDKDKTFSDILFLLNEYKFTRNPKWYDCMKHYCIYSNNATNTFDNMMYEKMTKTKNINDINNAIIETYIELKAYNDTINYLNYNKKYLDVNTIIKIIRKNNSTEIAKQIYAYVSTMDDNYNLTEMYFEMNMYDSVKNYISNENKLKIMNFLLETINVRGVVYMLEYYDKCMINERDANGNNMMHKLCILHDGKKYNDSEEIELSKMVKILVHYDNKILYDKNNDGNIPIFIACKNNCLTEIILLEQENITHTNNIGDNILHNIIRNGDIKVLNKICMYGNISNSKLIDEYNKMYDTPLLLACKLKREDMCNLLIRYGADKNIKDIYGNTLKHYICLYCMSDIEIDDIDDVTNIEGKTPSYFLIKYLCDKQK